MLLKEIKTIQINERETFVFMDWLRCQCTKQINRFDMTIKIPVRFFAEIRNTY